MITVDAEVFVKCQISKMECRHERFSSLPLLLSSYHLPLPPLPDPCVQGSPEPRPPLHKANSRFMNMEGTKCLQDCLLLITWPRGIDTRLVPGYYWILILYGWARDCFHIT